ncbi:MAG: hypothetical protein IT369_03330 [Candidatus Latescibacteria bacterium]|nr:hypothetical protein [Candidatus Latescibacterota bacterium]
MDDEKGAAGEGISLRFAVLLALGLLAMVLLLNLLGSPEVPVMPEYLQRLEKEDLLEAVSISPGGWHVLLRRPCRVDNGGGEMITRQIVVKGQGEPRAEVVSAWRQRGVRVDYAAEPEPRSGWAGGLLVSGLLGLGLWHLWQQMQRHRREGSPRQHLEALEQDFKEGRISQEEFQQRADLIMAEM